MENAHANNFNKAKCGKDCNQIGRLRGGIFYCADSFRSSDGPRAGSAGASLVRHVYKVAKPPACLNRQKV
jgi:hypothetical protein